MSPQREPPRADSKPTGADADTFQGCACQVCLAAKVVPEPVEGCALSLSKGARFDKLSAQPDAHH